MQRSTTGTGSDGRAARHARQHSFWGRLRRVLGGNETRRSNQETSPASRPSVDDIDALWRSHETLTARVQTLELENSELRHAHAAQVIPQRATEVLQRACASLGGTLPDETLLGALLSDFNHALGGSRVTLIFNAPLWMDTALEKVRAIPETPRLIDERSLDDLWNRTGAHHHESSSGASITVPLAHGGSTHAVLIAEIDGTAARFVPWQVQIAQTFSGVLGVALISAARHERGTKQLLLEQRTAVARKLRDSLLQSISFPRQQLGRLQSLASRMGSFGSDELNHVVNEVRDGIDQSIAQVRELLTELRPPTPRKDAERERR